MNTDADFEEIRRGFRLAEEVGEGEPDFRCSQSSISSRQREDVSSGPASTCAAACSAQVEEGHGSGTMPELDLEQVAPREPRNTAGLVACWVAALLLLLAAGILFGGKQEIAPPADMEYGWELVLVNRWHSLPKDWKSELTELSNGTSVDSRIYPALQQMFDDMRTQDIWPVVRDGWRSQEVQQQLMDQKIAEYRRDGYSRSEAASLAETWVAVPGTSEHQLGLAVDINPDVSLSTGDQVYGWQSMPQSMDSYAAIRRRRWSSPGSPTSPGTIATSERRPQRS